MPFSCFLFRPRKSRERRRKRSHTNVSNASVIRFSTPPAQTATFASADKSGYTLGFRRKIAHSGSHGEIGVFRTGVVSLPSERSAHSQTSPGRVSERCTLPLLGLGRGCSRRTQRASGTAMRLCASLSRGVAAPPGCVIFLLLSKSGFVHPALMVFCVCEAGVVSLLPVCSACC